MLTNNHHVEINAAGGSTMAIEERQRAHWRRLVQAHVAAENAHDLGAIMATFASHAVSQVNDVVSTTPDEIAGLHAFFGLAQSAGIFSGLSVVHEHEHFTDHEIVYEG